MKAHFEKISYILFIIILLLETVFLGIIWSVKHTDISFKNESMKTLKDGWTYVSPEGKEEDITLPASLGNDGTILLSRTLPEYIESDWVLATLSTHRSIYVYLDNRLIYSCKDDDLPINLAPGSMWNIINLPAEASKKVLTLEIVPEHTYNSGIVNEVFIGSKAAFLLHSIEAKGASLFISVLILLIGISLIIIYLFMHRNLKKNKSILYLGLFSCLISLWMLMQSNMMQFFIDNRYLISTIKYLALYTLPIPILFYISLMDNYRYKKIVMVLNSIFIINVVMMLFLQFLNIMNFHDGLLLLHILMAIIFSTLFFLLCIEVFKYKNKSLYHFLISFGILFFFSMVEIISYNFLLYANTGFFLQIGVMIFLIVLTLNSLKKTTEIVQLSENAKQYEYLAIRDYMTKCKNRNAYATELEQISLDQQITIILTDINNVKYINDTYGHHAGDFIIVKCSQLLLKTLGNDEYCYRIGGDEFVCIEYNLSENAIKEKVADFMKECDLINKDCPYPFEVSIGYAIYDKNIDKDIHDTVKRADKDMYRNKNSMKFSSL